MNLLLAYVRAERIKGECKCITWQGRIPRFSPHKIPLCAHISSNLEGFARGNDIYDDREVASCEPSFVAWTHCDGKRTSRHFSNRGTNRAYVTESFVRSFSNI